MSVASAIEWTQFASTGLVDAHTPHADALRANADGAVLDAVLGSESAAVDTGDDDVVHDVSWLEWFLDVVLQVKIPRARCGVRLVGNPDRPDPFDIGAPLCPRCAELAGYDEDWIAAFNGRRR